MLLGPSDAGMFLRMLGLPSNNAQQVTVSMYAGDIPTIDVRYFVDLDPNKLNDTIDEIYSGESKSAKVERALNAQVPGFNGTIKEYLRLLLITLWQEGDNFDGKRPFGDSGWKYDLYIALIKKGLIKGTLDSDGYVYEMPDGTEEADKLIKECIEYIFSR